MARIALPRFKLVLFILPMTQFFLFFGSCNFSSQSSPTLLSQISTPWFSLILLFKLLSGTGLTSYQHTRSDFSYFVLI